MQGIKNFRELGGLKTKDGYAIKNGIIFRSEALSGLTDADVQHLEAIHVRTIVDFRSNQEVYEHPDRIIDGAMYYNIAPDAYVAQIAAHSGKETETMSQDNQMKQLMAEYIDKPYQIMEDQMKRLVSTPESIEVYKKYIQFYLEPSNLPIIFHCRGGKDRAGLAAILILLILGVDPTTIVEEYMITETLNAEKNIKKMENYRKKISDERILEVRRALMTAKESYAWAALDEMKKLAGSYDSYLYTYLGLTYDMIEAIKSNCLVDYNH